MGHHWRYKLLQQKKAEPIFYGTDSVAWNQNQSLQAVNGWSSDWFGGIVAIYGKTMVVGSHYKDNVNGLGEGVLYEFTLRFVETWTEDKK